MDIVWFATVYSVLTITFFRRELMIERGSRNIIFGISLALFVAAVFASIVMRSTPTLFPWLMNPLVSLGLFLLMRNLFVRWKHGSRSTRPSTGGQGWPLIDFSMSYTLPWARS